MDAAASATTQDSTPSEEWQTKPRTMSAIMTRLFLISIPSCTARFSSSSMTAAMRSGATTMRRPYTT